jgi:NAD(P)-dependent dehydrogenase (short-subunit alcohol dehydrogenase family)
MGLALDISPSGLESLKGKSALITGGSNGICLAAAHLLSFYGAFVTIAGLSPPSETIANSVFAHCDVTNWESILSAFEATVCKHGRVDVLIANAVFGEVEDLFLDTLDDAGKLKQLKHTVLGIHLKGVVDYVKVAIHYMSKQAEGGAIMMTTSAAGYVGEKGLPVYATAKYGVIISTYKFFLQRIVILKLTL